MPNHSLETVTGPRHRGAARAWWLGLVAAVATAAPAAMKMPSASEMAAVFKPYRTDQAALSPDGEYLAYTVREGPILFLTVVPIEHPEAKAKIVVGEDDVSGYFQRRVTASVRVTWMHWSVADRLVYAATVPDPGRRLVREEVRMVAADGKNDHKLVDAQDFEDARATASRGGRRGGGGGAGADELVPRRPRVLGFCRDEPEAILVEATGGRRVPTGVYRVDLASGKAISLSEEDEDGRYLYDREGRARILEPPAVRFPTPMPRMEGGRRGGGAPGFQEEPQLVAQEFSYRLADGTHGWQTLDAYLGRGHTFGFKQSAENFYGRRSFPIAFADDPEVLYFASNLGRDTYGIYALDLRTKQRTDLAVEVPGFDLVDPGDALASSMLVFDRQHRLMGVRLPGARLSTRWLDDGLEKLQQGLDAKFPGRQVELLDWDDARHRVLLWVSSAADPGRYFIYENDAAGRLTEMVRRAPWLTPETLNVTNPFAITTPGGIPVTGMLTLPHVARITPPPLILICRDLPGRRERPGFNREAQALADMGLVVAQVNYRGIAGLGTQHRDAIKEGFDRVPIEDLRATVNWIMGQHQINPKRVALLGEGYGGYLALRALQLYPKEFRCAIGINAPSDPARWVNEPPLVNGRSMVDFSFEVRRTFFDRARLKGLGIAQHVEATAKPVFIIQDPEQRSLWASEGMSVRDAMKKQGLDVEYLEVPGDFVRADSEERARVFAKIAGFVNDHVYDYAVDIGETKEVK